MTSKILNGMDSENSVNDQPNESEEDVLPADINHLDFDGTLEIPSQKLQISNSTTKHDALDSVSIALAEANSGDELSNELPAAGFSQKKLLLHETDSEEGCQDPDKFASAKNSNLGMNDTLDLDDTQNTNNSVPDVSKNRDPKLLDNDEQHTEKKVDLDKIHEELLDEMFD